MTYANPTNLTGIGDMFIYTNSVSNNIFGAGVLLSLYLIILLYLKINGERLQAAMMAAGFVTTLVSIMFFFIGIVTGFHLFLCILVTIIAAVWQMADSD